MLWIASLALVLSAAVTAPQDGARTFYMGFSDWNYGPLEQDRLKTMELVQQHGDLISFQFNDGIPWPEAYEGKPYSSYLEERIAFRLDHLKGDRKIYLEIAVLNIDRSDIAGYIGTSGNLPRPAPWDGYAIDDERMITAYANFCLNVIGRLKPDFVNYGLESTDYLFHHPENWPAFVRFHQAVYERIKARYPDLLLGISMPLKHPDSAEAKQLHERVADLLPCIDFLAGSAYPYVFFGHPDAGNPANLPERWLRQLVDAARDKPIAMGETNWLAEDLVLPRWGVDVKGTPEWQKEYAGRLLEALNRHHALFVVWWSVADFDRLWAIFPDEVKDLGRIWRDTGLYDGDLQPRPALQVWEQWLSKPVQPVAP